MATADQLFTKVNLPAFEPKLRYNDPVFMAGSCFTEHIGDKLARYKYDVLSNPFGILYNPASLATSFDRIARLAYYHADELVLYDGLYHSMDHHGAFSGKNKEVVLEKINQSIQLAHGHLKRSKIVCISPGTSNVYRYKESGTIVGNCHKIPQTHFNREGLTLSQCAEAFESMLDSIMKLASEARIIWTVSPVRHTRDGLIENQRSKSKLILGIEEVIRNHPESSYFPAYEIMMDQLRDYRYYARDMIHPSPLAVDIIWDTFCDTYLHPQDRVYHVPIDKIKRAMEHRVLHEDPEGIRAFAQGQLKNIEHLAGQLPDLNWQSERLHFFQYIDID
jgi:hypothetical protein